jgi:hypothetical protein
MTTPEIAVQIAFDIIQEVIASGADPRGPQGSGAAWTIDAHGTPAQRAQLQRLVMAASREHGAVPERTTAKEGKTKTADAQGMDALDRAIRKSFGLDA